MNIYGVLDRNGCHLDVSTSLKGAKRYATSNGYNQISVRYDGSCIAAILFTKVGKYWKPFNN